MKERLKVPARLRKLPKFGSASSWLFTTHDRPGHAPGIEHARTSPDDARVDVAFTVIDYDADTIQRHDFRSLDELLAAPANTSGKRWLNVNGLRADVVQRLHQHYGFHTLAAEDVLKVPQRPQAIQYDDHVFVTLRMLTIDDDGLVTAEQVSMFVFHNLVITFQERPGDVWDPIRQRLQVNGSRIRKSGSDYLAYSLIDAAVDHCFPILENYGNRLEELENEILLRPQSNCVEMIYRLKRQLLLIRRAVWPLRELCDGIFRLEGKNQPFGKESKQFMRDVVDHVIQIIDVLETYRELTGSLSDLYMSQISHRMNQVMKVLTLMASLFIPITFIAGVYGMNFEHIPELKFKYGYAVFWIVELTIIGSMLFYFHRKGWFKD